MFFNSNASLSFSKRFLYGTSLSAMALLMARSAVAQNATQQQAQQSQQIETVTVTATGTLIRGVAPVGADVVTFDASDIQASGALTTDQIMNDIPQLANTFNQNTVAPTAGNIGGVRPSIRYLPSTAITGGSATLVLMDGHNMIGVSGLATAPDPGLIPAIALKRVDVLPDGASSLYGANAVTGVINFVTRDDFTGFETNLALGHADGYNAFDASALAGVDWASGGAFAAVEYRANSMLLARDRAFTAMNLVPLGGRDSRGTACALPNITAVGASPNNYTQTGYPANTPGSLAANVSGPFPGLNSVTNAGSLNRCDTNQNISLFPTENQPSLFAAMHQEIAPGVIFSAKFLVSSRFDSQQNSIFSTTGTIDSTNPYFQSLHGETQQTVQFDFSPFLGTNHYSTTNYIQEVQFNPDLTIQLPFGDWIADILGDYGRSFSNAITPGGVNSTLLNNSLRQQTINGVTSPALTANPVNGNAVDPYNIAITNPTLVQSILDDGALEKAVQHQNQGQVTFNGTLFTLPWGGAVKAAIGGKYDWEDYQARWSVNTPAGDFKTSIVPFGEQSVWESIHRTIGSGFAEITAPLVSPENNIPFVKSFSMDVSGRIDGYDDFGTASTYKIGIGYDPIDELTIKGTKGTSYDAPSLADTLGPDGRYNYTPQRTSPNAIVPPGTTAAQALAPSILVPGGNPNLGPEDGTTWSLGGDFHPQKLLGMDLSGLDLSLTRWHIFIEHQLGLAPFSSNLLFQVPSYSQYFIINPTLAQVQSYGYTTCIGCVGVGIASAYAPGLNPPYILYDARRNNLGNAKMDGFDFAETYRRQFDFAAITASFSGTYNLQNATQGAPGQPWTSIQANAVPVYEIYAYLQANEGPVEERVSVQYSPGFLVNPGSQAFLLYNQVRIPSFHPVNLYLSYDLGKVFDWSNGASISLSINNIADEEPPLYLSGGSALSTNGAAAINANGTTLGRYFLLDLRKQF
jgi:iron complex outermembrane receptor protein